MGHLVSSDHVSHFLCLHFIDLSEMGGYEPGGCGCRDMPEGDKGPCLCLLWHGSFWFIFPSVLDVALCTNGVVWGSLLAVGVGGCPGCSLAGGWGGGKDQHHPHPTTTLHTSFQHRIKLHSTFLFSNDPSPQPPP